jgi:hypothetical protein
MISEPSVFARIALVTTLTTSLILGVLATTRPLVHLTDNIIAIRSHTGEPIWKGFDNILIGSC